MRVNKHIKIDIYLRLIPLTAFLYIAGCAKEPINYETDLVEKEGVYFTKDSDLPYSGEVFTLYTSGDIKEEGKLEKGLMSGSWTYWNEDGNKYSEETYKNGYKEGQFILYKDGNRQREGGYLNRKKHGLFIEWYDNGQMKQEGTFKEGRLSGVWS